LYAKEIREGIIYSNSMIYDEVMTIKLLLEDLIEEFVFVYKNFL
jgi:hypothetical protein